MEFVNQACCLMGVSGENEMKLKCPVQESDSQNISGVAGDKIVDSVLRSNSIEGELLHQMTYESDTYCQGSLMKSPKSSFPATTTCPGNQVCLQEHNMPPKQALRVQIYQPKRNEFSIDSFGVFQSPCSVNGFEL